MEVRSNAEALKTLLGVPVTAATHAPHGRGALAAGQNALAGDRAIVSFAGAEVSSFYCGCEESCRCDARQYRCRR